MLARLIFFFCIFMVQDKTVYKLVKSQNKELVLTFSALVQSLRCAVINDSWCLEVLSLPLLLVPFH